MSTAAKSDKPVHKFSDLRLSARTLKGLHAAKFAKPTDIQKLVIPRALAGADVVASAKTGSGKTLAFVVPALELLHREQWSRDLGLGVLIVAPTRELAYQIFREIRRVGGKHRFSLGLITGGYHDVKEQGARVGRMNILVATPGRLVQHLSERPDLGTDNLRLLVLDEADRILHLGFKAELDALLDYLPPSRQTLLFSATQTRSLQDLVRLKMRQPDSIDTSREAATATPEGLRQAYVRCQTPGDKPRFLWQFITGNRQRKSIVFFATCKQVRFHFELLQKLRPGVRVLQLHGGMTQRRRTAVYDEFARVQHALLLSTDLASRGLDFPGVDCVLQADCPPDLRTYVHRVGRTARLSRSGRAVALLLDWEADTLPGLLAALRPPVLLELAQPRLPVKWDILGKIAGLVAADPELRAIGERALRAYVKTYACFAEMKQVFQAKRLDLASLAKSYGLVQVPRLPPTVLARGVVRPSGGAAGAAKSGGELALTVDSDNDSDGDGDGDANCDFLVAKEVVETSASASAASAAASPATAAKKRRRVVGEGDGEEADVAEVAETGSKKNKKKSLTRARLAKRILAKGIRPYRHVAFDEDGEAVADPRLPDVAAAGGGGGAAAGAEADGEGGLAIDEAKRDLAVADAVDKRLYRELLRRQHREAKAKAKAARAKARVENPVFAAGRKRARLADSDSGDEDEDEDEDEEGSKGEFESE